MASAVSSGNAIEMTYVKVNYKKYNKTKCYYVCSAHEK